jgi:hypothetical protein
VNETKPTNRPDSRPTDHVKGLPLQVAQRCASTGSADADVLKGLMFEGER